MECSLFIYNERSGSVDSALVEAIRTQFAQAGRPITQSINLADGDLPTTADAEQFSLVVILSGDGSISAAADALAGWPGVILPLPGGTMNLLVRALHGDMAAGEIVTAFLAGEGRALSAPVIRDSAQPAYTGIMAGRTALWGDVREDMRNRDLASLGQTVPRALSATLEEPGICIAGHSEAFPAIYLEPSEAGIRAHGIRAEGAGDLIRHGLAWLSGDFRNGPSEEIAILQELDILAPEDRLELLVDGERAEAMTPYRLTFGHSEVRFHSIRGQFSWT